MRSFISGQIEEDATGGTFNTLREMEEA